jgi:poly-gamma-glutamate synthesis protein (capsule biosynthesis protein)
MKVYFFGDVYLDRSYGIDFELDKFIFNLEYPLSRQGTPAVNKVNLGADEFFFQETFGKNPIAVCLANNHIMDYGTEAFEKTVEHLKNHNIQFFGAGKAADNFNNPAIVDFFNYNLALFGYSCSTTHAVFGSEATYGSALLDVKQMIEDIRKVRDHTDYVVVQLHWGDEEIAYPKPIDVKIAHSLIDNGADLVIGHHAHVIQSHEVYHGKYIFYGLGNLIFPDLDVPAGYDGSQFARRYIKLQEKRNHRSLMVTLDKNLHIDYSTLEFDNEFIRKKSFRIPSWIPAREVSYRLYRFIWFKAEMLKAFLNNPQIPTLKQTKLFCGIK